MEDRFHLELIRLWDVPGVVDKESSSDVGSASYKFFSRQSTAGRVSSSIASNLGKDVSTELLVVYPPPASGNDTQTENEKRYRRLPNTMTLHDAQNSGYVNEFDVVVIRIYALNSTNGGEEYDGPSKSVLESDNDNDDMDTKEGSNDKEDEGVDTDTKPTSMEIDSESSNAVAPQQSPQEQSQQELQQRIHAAFQSLEDNSSNNPAKKKKKPVSKQVRSMLIKSKSTGNVRVKLEERLYLEVILFHDDQQPGSSSITNERVPSSYRFFSKLNDMQHIITVCGTGSNSGKASNSTQVELIVERTAYNNAAEGCVYKALPKSLTLGDAIQQGHIENFGRVLLRICNNDESYLPCDNL